MELKQFVVRMENDLADMLKKLAKDGVNLRSLSVSGKGGAKEIRFLPSDAVLASQVLMHQQIPARIEKVLVVKFPDKEASLAKLLFFLKENGVRLEGMNALSGMDNETAVMVFSFSDNNKAHELMEQKGIYVLDANEMGIDKTKFHLAA